ncbi:protein translocase subunit SecD [Patescibacteria group bacterium]|nr:protein translocase subunit SecD [Patescibacteria group bacterium]
MLRIRIAALLILLVGLGIGYFVYTSEINTESRFKFKLGLDLAGGTHLIYEADVSNLPQEEIEGSMNALRDVIERRVNLFGVSEPIVQVEQSSIFAGVRGERLIVELPGVTDITEAVRIIGETPLLEFKLVRAEALLPENGTENVGDIFIQTELTGRFLKRAVLEFGSTQSGQISNEPIIRLEFTKEGADIFAEITRNNVGRQLAIFLDGESISAPVIQQEITGGTAIITGSFTPESAKLLVRNLNFGALPVPIELLSTQTIGASLGEEALNRGIQAGMLGLTLVALFLILWYRLPGVLATLSLAIYVFIILALFKFIPVTLTAAGLAGFILSIGMAVDANILIFERMKEEFIKGKDTTNAVKDGFARAWFSIRDGNISSIITAVILFWFGTSLVKGFALTFGIGILVSMISAITISRTFLYAVGGYSYTGLVKFLFGRGISL